MAVISIGSIASGGRCRAATLSTARGRRARLRGLRRGGRLLLRRFRLQPGGEIVLAAHVHDDRHEAVVASAELRALSPIESRLVGVHLEPGLVHEPRYGVLLDAEGGHPPGMD